MKASHSILNSRLATQVLRKIAEEDEGNYGSKMADQLGKSQASMGRILSELNEIGFLKKGKRKKAQYYKLDYEAIADYWFERVLEELKDVRDDIKREKYLGEGYTTKKEMLDGMKNSEPEIKEVVAAYIEKVLTSDAKLDRYTVSDLLFESVGFSVGHNLIQDETLLEKYPFLEQPIDALVYLWKMDGFPGHLREVLKEIEKD